MHIRAMSVRTIDTYRTPAFLADATRLERILFEMYESVSLAGSWYAELECVTLYTMVCTGVVLHIEICSPSRKIPWQRNNV